MNSLFKNTKIVSTSGPAITKSLAADFDLVNSVKDPEYLEVLDIFEDLFLYGVNCIRFNFSHSNAPEREFRLKLINKAQNYIIDNAFKNLAKSSSSQLKFVRPITNMCDTKGPEIRVYKFKGDGSFAFQRGSKVEIHCIQKILGDSTAFSVLDSTGKYNMAEDCKIGNKILVDDGKLSISIVAVNTKDGIVTGTIDNTHSLKANKRINLPGADYSMPFLSENDKQDIKFAHNNNFHLIALSFVNKAQDIKDVKQILIDNTSCDKKHPLLFSKIETLQSLKNIDEIIAESDGIMVARGDLGLEIPFCEVPYWTKVIIKKCAIKNIPVIVATQMLDSLEKNIIPTRAEVTDVYRAAELGADSTMLSGETAQGLFPIIAVKTMKTILCESEKHSNSEKFINHFKNHPNFSSTTISQVMELYEILKKHQGEILSVVAFDSDLPEGFLTAFTAAKMPVSITVFAPTLSYEDSLNDLLFTNFSISRGVNHVGIINFKNECLLECFNNYCISFSQKLSSTCEGKKALFFENKHWVIKNL